jgi:hypothetical protein
VDVNAGERSVSLPYDRATVESAPEMEEPSGAFDAAVHEHYEGRT